MTSKDRSITARISPEGADIIGWAINRFGKKNDSEAVRFLIEHAGASLQTIFGDDPDPKNHGKLQRDMIIDQMSAQTRQLYVKELLARLGGERYITHFLKDSSWRQDIYTYANNYDDEMPSNKDSIRSAFQYLNYAIIKALNYEDLKQLQESLHEKCGLVDQQLADPAGGNGSQTLTSHREALRSIWEHWEEGDLAVLNLVDIELLSTILHANSALLDEFLSLLERIWKRIIRESQDAQRNGRVTDLRVLRNTDPEFYKKEVRRLENIRRRLEETVARGKANYQTSDNIP